MDVVFQAEFEEDYEYGMDDVFPRDEDRVVDCDNKKGYDAEECAFLKEVPPYPEGYMYVGAQ